MSEEKLVPELRFPEFEGEWERKKLVFYVDIIDGDRGKNYPKKMEMTKEGYCLFLNAGNVTKSGFEFNEREYITKEKDMILRSGKLKRNDIVLTTRGTVGNIAYYDDSVIDKVIRINSGMIILRSDNVSTQHFLYYLLNTHIFKKILSFIVFGSAQPQLTKRDLSKLKFNFPTKKEQEKIGNFFQAIDKKIELQEELIDNLEEQKKGLMQKIFNQEVRFKDGNGKDYPEWEKEIVENIITSIPVRKHQILSGKIKDKGLYPVVTQSKEYIDGYFNDIKKVCFEKPIILFGDHTTVFKYINFDFIVGGDGVKIFKVNPDKYNLKFIYYNLIYKNITMQGYRRHFSLLREIYLMIPNLKEQKKIAEFLSLADKRIDLEKEQLENYKEYKKGLMQRMFI